MVKAIKVYKIEGFAEFISLLGLTIQLLTGLFLAIHYTCDVNIAFNRVVYICRDVNNG